MLRRLAFAALLCAPLPAQALELSLPVDCALGRDCFIQHLVDRIPGPGVQDFACGAASYEGHEGVDIRVPALTDLKRGVTIRAAAEGRVVRAMDSQLDHMLEDGQALFAANCGNGVTLEHGEGWITQYCHMVLGSVQVRVGDVVQRGQPLGNMGVSGATSFPHLHFAVKKGELVADPFKGACGGSGLWRGDSGLAGWTPRPEILNWGLAGAPPTLQAVKTDPAALPPPAGGRDFIFIWAQVLGARPGDELRASLRDPSGKIAADEPYRVDSGSGVFFLRLGVEPKDGGYEIWPPGGYEGSLRLLREGRELLRDSRRIDLR
ncbi:M23 family metallopeptidase [Neomegalonema perideroedes]|uniref:M23 family metallopeptidase n=1 Tax=Neomegalonema perideroedes TaxID=217219 RepID=UPI00039CCECE|nr:M23 family metallopeptidase [Neomegalonema perideroedes]